MNVMKNSATIIPVYAPKCQIISWKSYLKSAFVDSAQLLDYLEIPHSNPLPSFHQKKPIHDLSTINFPVRVPIPFADKMEKGNVNDPLLLQVLSTAKENLKIEGYIQDPLNEQQSKVPGLLHKYTGRVLLILTGSCAVNCRYCFRRHFPYAQQVAMGKNLQRSINYIQKDSTISEVILSGGDPLLMSDRQLLQLINQLQNIKHLKRLRIHTRLPIVIPQRLTDNLLHILSNTSLKTSMVIHANHANEIDQALGEALTRLVRAGITVFNQSVLLKNINDHPTTLANLSEKLYEYQVVPYYIHLLDPVAGAAHFDVSKSTAIQIMQKLAEKLPGYLVPKLAQDEPCTSSKTVITG